MDSVRDCTGSSTFGAQEAVIIIYIAVLAGMVVLTVQSDLSNTTAYFCLEKREGDRCSIPIFPGGGTKIDAKPGNLAFCHVDRPEFQEWLQHEDREKDKQNTKFTVGKSDMTLRIRSDGLSLKLV